MTPGLLLRRSLAYHRGIHIAVALGVAVGTAVLAGALLVGDSVRGSLRSLTLDRLGAIDHALVTDRYFREALAQELVDGDKIYSSIDAVAPAVLIRGSLQSADSGARASRVNIHGVDERFWLLFNTARVETPGADAGGDGGGGGTDVALPEGRQLALNEALAREVGAKSGDAVLVRFQTDTLVPSESVMGRKADNVRTLRLTVAAVLPDRGIGRFGLSPSQQLPYNVFLPMATLQRALEQPGRANAIFVAGGEIFAGPNDTGGPPGSPPRDSADSAASADSKMIAIPGHDLNLSLMRVLQLDDLNLSLETRAESGVLSIETDRIVLEPASSAAATSAARAAGMESSPVLTYLANNIAVGDRGVPYSTVTAIDTAAGQPFGPLPLASGQPAPALGEDEILLNDWAAKDLDASVGDAVELSYYLVGEQGALETERHTFTLTGIIKLSGLAADQHLAPKFEGMSDADRMGDWDPPFPVDLSKIRAIDEDYWDSYRTAPKAFVSLETAKKLWSSRFGQLTAVRVAPAAGQSLDEASVKLRQELMRHLNGAAYGLSFQPVKAQALDASSGATDFSELFIGFSMFLIVSAAMLVALLFRLGVERRSKEIGLLLAGGQPISMVRWLLLTEATIVASVGCLLGLPGAVGYAALMVHGLSTWWSDAVGGSFLELHVAAPSLIGGAVGSLLMMVISIWLGVRKLEQLSPRSMLAGTLEEASFAASYGPASAAGARRPRIVALTSAGLAALLAVIAATVEDVPAAAVFFGVGALLLVASLAFFRVILLRRSAGVISGQGVGSLAKLGARNGRRYPTRSVLSAGLVASATFVIVAVALNRHDVTSQEPSLNSGDGGFRFIAESDLPVYRDQLEFEKSDEAVTTRVFSLRAKPGEDASCLNLYRPSKPTLLGASADLMERGGFAFQGTLADTEREVANPWLLLDKKLAGDAIPVFGDVNSVKYILHLGLEKDLTFTDEQGRPRRLVIAGLLSRSVFQSQLIMSEANFLDLFPSHSGYNQFLVETDSPEAGTLLEERFADQGFDATRTADRLAGYLIVENTYLSTFQTLGGLGLLLGTLGLAVVMIRSVLERRSELALLQAVGFGGSSISCLVLAENGFLLVFGVVIGALAALLAVLPHLLSGMAEPPWVSLLGTLLLIITIGLLAGAAAVGTSLRTPLLAALRRE